MSVRVRVRFGVRVKVRVRVGVAVRVRVSVRVRVRVRVGLKLGLGLRLGLGLGLQVFARSCKIHSFATSSLCYIFTNLNNHNHDLTIISIIRVLTRHLYNYNTMMISQMSVFCECEQIDLFQC